MTHNPNCDGGHCRNEFSDVRVYPLGGGGNLILCEACFHAENEYRKYRGKETGAPENWPIIAWATAEPYPDNTKE
jgi:hypothetical protein